MNVLLSQLAWKDGCNTSFVLAKKALNNQFMNVLSCTQGCEIIEVLVFNAKNSTSKQDSIDWYKLAIDGISKIKEIDKDFMITQKTVFMIEMAQNYIDLKDYNNAENMIILAFEQDSSNLMAYRVLLEITTLKDSDHNSIKDIFKRMIQSQNDFKSKKSIKIYMSMIYTVQKVSADLALECVNLFKPDLWKNKNISYDSFLIVKIYFMCLQKNGASEEVFNKEIQELQNVALDDDVKRSCQMVMFQAGDTASKDQNWSDAIFWYTQSLLIFGNLDEKDSNYGEIK